MLIWQKNDLVLATKARSSVETLSSMKWTARNYVGRVIAQEKDQVTWMSPLFERPKSCRKNTLRKCAEISSFSRGFGLLYLMISLLWLKTQEYDKITKDSYLILNDRRENMKDSREFGLGSKPVKSREWWSSDFHRLMNLVLVRINKLEVYFQQGRASPRLFLYRNPTFIQK